MVQLLQDLMQHNLEDQVVVAVDVHQVNLDQEIVPLLVRLTEIQAEQVLLEVVTLMVVVAEVELELQDLLEIQEQVMGEMVLSYHLLLQPLEKAHQAL